MHAEDGSSPKEYTAEFGYFWSVTVENMRCFTGPETLELQLDGKVAKWTVILGNNGVGKTTLLQCLHALEPVTRSSPLSRGQLPGANPRSQSSWAYGAWRYDTVKRTDGTPVRLSSQMTLNEDLERRSADPTTWEIEWNRQGRKIERPTNLRFTLFSCAYGAGRKPGAAALVASETSNAATLFVDNAQLLAADEWFLQSDYAAKSTQTPEAIGRSERIKQTLIHLLPDVEDLRVAGLDRQPPSPALEAKTPYGWVHVRDLSLGYRTLMAWVVDFASRMFTRYPHSEDPLSEPAVCLVDEIDLHLHPSWQRKLIAYLDELFPRTQFIVTAHSPLVVQAAENAKIAVLKRHDGDDFVTIHNDLDTVRGWRIDQILTSDLFDLDGSRSPRVNELLGERAGLLRKAVLDEGDRRRLAELDSSLSELPQGDSPEDREAWEVVHQFASGISDGSITK